MNTSSPTVHATPSNNRILSVRNLEKIYGKKSNVTRALNQVSFDVERGEFIALMGPSGSGKTTLLNCISTIDAPTSGQILLNGTDITHLKGNKLTEFRKRELGFIFQDFNLLDSLTAYENIALALTIQRVSAREIDMRVRNAARELGVEGVLDRFPYELSGGQCQRVATARALVGAPSLILGDEPTGALDSRSSRVLLESLATLNTEHQATIVMVTHDSYAASFASRVLFLKDGMLYNELLRGDDNRKSFYMRVLEVVSVMGGDTDYADANEGMKNRSLVTSNLNNIPGNQN